jgi:hypothetical protein
MQRLKNKPPTKNIKFSWNLMSLETFFNIYSINNPNKAIETTIGPIVVPNEFIPPARFNLLDAESVLRDAAKVDDCNEKPVLYNKYKIKE